MRSVCSSGPIALLPHRVGLLLRPHRVGRPIALDRSYVRRVVNLTLLSPDLVRAILDGSEPDGLSLTQLMRDVPERWEEQGAMPHGG